MDENSFIMRIKLLNYNGVMEHVTRGIITDTLGAALLL